MKIKGFALGNALTALFCVSTLASDVTFDGAAVTSNAEPSSDPVTELRHQDSAFSLLIEAFRQLQSHLIQSDYEARLKAAANLNDLKTRRQVSVLAKQERDVRMKKLYGQLSNLSTTYDYTRQRNEREAGVEAPSAVDTAAAAEKLKGFVVIAPGHTDVRSIPATSVLLDTRATP